MPTYVAGKLDTVMSPLYDTLVVATTTAIPDEVNLFGSIQGHTGVGAEHTNMRKAFELAAPESFVVLAMRCVFYDTAKADMYKFMKSYAVRLMVGNKPYLEAPADYFAGGAGIAGDPANGIVDPRAITASPQYPVPINNGDTFRVRIVGTTMTTTAAFFLRVYLDGLYSRGVQ